MNKRDASIWEEIKSDARELGQDLAGEEFGDLKDIIKPFLGLWRTECASYGWDAEANIVELSEILGKAYADARGVK
ncbi:MULTISPECIES: hypothetical protein [Streptomyces]